MLSQVSSTETRCLEAYHVDVGLADIKSLTLDSPDLFSNLGPAFEKYNEEQFVTVKLPGSSQPVGDQRLSNTRRFGTDGTE
jgi:hypothetical protein